MTPLIANWRLYLDGVLLGESKYRYEADHAQQYFCVISKNTAVAPKMTLNPPSLCLSRHFRLSRNRDLTHNPLWRVLSVIAFHEKAGRSQVDSLSGSWNIFVLPPSGHCRHASIRTLEERFHFARCMLGVLVSAGAAICLSPCGSALAEWNLGQAINAVTGTRLWLLSFLFLERF